MDPITREGKYTGIGAIMFDLEGTLVQSEKLRAQAYAIAVQRLRGRLVEIGSGRNKDGTDQPRGIEGETGPEGRL